MEETKKEEEQIDPNAPRSWYFTNAAVVLAFLCVYPFVLPLIWLNPHYTSSRKVFLTFIVLVISAVVLKAAIMVPR